MIQLIIKDDSDFLDYHKSFVQNDNFVIKRKLTMLIKTYLNLSEISIQLISNATNLKLLATNDMTELFIQLQSILSLEQCLDEKEIITTIITDAEKVEMNKEEIVGFFGDFDEESQRKLIFIEKNYCKLKDLCEFLIINLESLSIGDTKILQEIQFNFLSKVKGIDNDFLYRKFHEQIEDIFNKAYDNFCDLDNFVEYKSGDGKSEIVKWNAYQYVNRLMVSICPYCNVNTIPTLNVSQHLYKAGKKARPALDHFIPKSIYPIFAVSLYNLIPTCTYCNSSFKRDYYSSFTNCYSPLEQGIEEDFHFEIVSRKEADNSFRELSKVRTDIYLDEEIHYMQLLGKNPFKYTSNLDQILCNLRELKIYTAKNARESFKEKVDLINELLIIWEERFVKYYFDNDSTINCIILVNDYQKLLKTFIDVLAQEPSKKSTYVVKNLRKAINYIRDILAIILSNNFYEFNLIDNYEFDFTDVSLGKSENYVIKITSKLSSSERAKIKVLHNVSLFQLESLYEQFKPYINEKLDQSYRMNQLYKAQLVDTFPSWLDHNYVNQFTDSLFHSNENYRNNMLGKLTFDLIKPTVNKNEDNRLPFVF